MKAPETKKPVPSKAAPKKAAAKKAAPKKPAAKTAASNKTTPKATPKKAVQAKAVAKKTTPKKPASKAAATKPPVTKQPAKKASTQKQPVAKAKASKAAPAVKAKKTAAPKASTSAKAKPRSAKRTTGNVGSDSTASFTPYVVKRNEAYMNEPQRSHFKSILLNWRNQLMEEVDRTVSHMKDEAANYPDPSDRASQEEEFSLELRTRDRERKLIRKIEKTIDLIDQDDYGYCDTCGVEIGIRRLEARPTANQCIDCKTLDELKERQLHG